MQKKLLETINNLLSSSFYLKTFNRLYPIFKKPPYLQINQTIISNFTKLIIIAFFSLSSCTLQPKYSKPKSPISEQEINDLEIIEKNKNEAEKKAEELLVESNTKEVLWRDYFIDNNLQKIIETALDNNRNLKIAGLNIEAARSYYRISRADLMPQITAQNYELRTKSYNYNYQKYSNFYSRLALTAFELDFFGKLRSLKDAALQDFFATQQAHDSVKISLIAEVANAYIDFITNHQNMVLAYEISQIANDKFEIAKIRYENGIDSREQLLAEKTLLNNAKISLANYQKIVSQSKNILQTLVGNYDEKIFDSYDYIQELEDIKIAQDLLRFIPSSKLLKRPDIQQAESNLKSANANIGAARAAFFPSFMITGNIGYNSNKLDNLFSSSTKAWTFSPQVNLPIFSGGANMANLKLSHIRKKIEIVNYEKAIENAFKELKDQLAIRKSIDEQLALSKDILNLQNEIYKISLAKYDLGNESKYNMLSQKISFLRSKQEFLQIKKDHFSNLINIYKTLGGGLEKEGKEVKVWINQIEVFKNFLS